MRLLLTSLLLPALSLAQSVSGTVFDASHFALPAAAVNIRNIETGTARSTIPDSSGRFAAVGLAIGAYTLTASKDGFSSLTKTGITLALGEDATVNLTLSVDQFKQT